MCQNLVRTPVIPTDMMGVYPAEQILLWQEELPTRLVSEYKQGCLGLFPLLLLRAGSIFTLPIHTSLIACPKYSFFFSRGNFYEGWNFNSGNYLFTTDTK